jgi:hypothetical protein
MTPAADNIATAALRAHLDALEATLGGIVLSLYPDWSPGSHRVAVRQRDPPAQTRPPTPPPWHALDLLVDAAAWAADSEVVSLLWPPLATSASLSHPARQRDLMRALVGLSLADLDSAVTIEAAVQAWQVALAYATHHNGGAGAATTGCEVLVQ